MFSYPTYAVSLHLLRELSIESVVGPKEYDHQEKNTHFHIYKLNYYKN